MFLLFQNCIKRSQDLKRTALSQIRSRNDRKSDLLPLLLKTPTSTDQTGIFYQYFNDRRPVRMTTGDRLSLAKHSQDEDGKSLRPEYHYLTELKKTYHRPFILINGLLPRLYLKCMHSPPPLCKLMSDEPWINTKQCKNKQIENLYVHYRRRHLIDHCK